MGMHQTLDVINAMEADGVIGRYAIAGAIAAYNYIEASLTEDLDILVSFEDMPGQAGGGLPTLAPILAYLAGRGYAEFVRDGLMIEGWPVQFLPVADDLEAQALGRADTVEIRLNPRGSPVHARVLGAEYLVAMAVKVGRPKDRLRVVQFLTEEAVRLDTLRNVLQRHDLMTAWQDFCRTAGMSKRHRTLLRDQP